MIAKHPAASQLLAAAKNVNSQYGEDGIIEAILQALPSRNKWCVEFGAWDGRYLSNTRRLIDECGYRGIMIEGDSSSFVALQQSLHNRPEVTCVQAFVGFTEKDNLDRILEKTECPPDFDLLSIDIDGNDIHVWEALEKYRPKVVCIEFNQTIPTAVDFVQPADPDVKWGCSLLALYRLGHRKRYRLVCANELNGFFVANECWSAAHAETEADLACFRKREPDLVYVFSGYDGTVLLSADAALGWHGYPIRQNDVQVLPRFLRRYPMDYSWVQRMLYAVLCRMKAR